MLLQIDAPYFCAGAVLKELICKEAAPIIRYMTGWELRRIQSYCQAKGWKTKLLKKEITKAARIGKINKLNMEG